MGSKISRLCEDFSLKSTCISNCCSNGSKNDVVIEEPKENIHHKHHKHKHKHKHHKENETNDVVG